MSKRFFAAGARSRLQISVPSMGESITEGSISAIFKKSGDRVEENEIIAQIDTDKVTFDVRAPEAGVLQQILVKPSPATCLQTLCFAS